MNRYSTSTRDLVLFGIMLASTLGLTIVYESLSNEAAWKYFAQVFGGVGTVASLTLIVKMTPVLQKKVKHYLLAIWLITVGVGLMSLSYLCNGVFSTKLHENLLIGFITLVLGFSLMTYSLITDTLGETQ